MLCGKKIVSSGGGQYLALFAVLALACGANALNVVNKHTESGQLVKEIVVTTAGTYKHEALAPASGNLTSDVRQLGGDRVDQIFVESGACWKNTISLQQTGNGITYALDSFASFTTGFAKAQVRSSEVVSLCPNGNGN